MWVRIDFFSTLLPLLLDRKKIDSYPPTSTSVEAHSPRVDKNPEPEDPHAKLDTAISSEYELDSTMMDILEASKLLPYPTLSRPFED